MLKMINLLVRFKKCIADELTVSSLCSRLGLDGMKMQVRICSLFIFLHSCVDVMIVVVVKL